jgi:hypothetical protein
VYFENPGDEKWNLEEKTSEELTNLLAFVEDLLSGFRDAVEDTEKTHTEHLSMSFYEDFKKFIKEGEGLVPLIQEALAAKLN